MMAFLEWFLWLAAFLYCIFKAFQKAEHWSIKALCVVVGFAFFLMRYVSRPTVLCAVFADNHADWCFCPS